MKIEHIGMFVSDLEKAKHFFITYFQAVSNELYYNSKTGLKTYFLAFNEGPRLEIMHRDDLKQKCENPHKEGYHHIAFEIKDKETLDALTDKLKIDGYQIISGPRITGDGYYESLFLFDNHHIELVLKK